MISFNCECYLESYLTLSALYNEILRDTLRIICLLKHTFLCLTLQYQEIFRVDIAVSVVTPYQSSPATYVSILRS